MVMLPHPPRMCVCVRARGWAVESPSTSRVVSVYSGFVSRQLRACPSVHSTRGSAICCNPRRGRVARPERVSHLSC